MRPAARGRIAGQGTQGCGLAGTVGTDQAHHLALGGLVERKHLRLGGKCAGDLQTALVAVRQVA